MLLANINSNFKKFIGLFILAFLLLNPLIAKALNISDPSVSLLQNRISNNFTSKFCSSIKNGYSKDEAMTAAIIKTENIIAFSYNPQKKWIEPEDLANHISLEVINDCGKSIGLVGKQGVNYFNSYFLEIYQKTTPDKKLSR